nr:hypothetical protein [Tanacetum cinerariifolium]
MNMLNSKYRTSFAKPEFLKKAQRANPHLYDIGCYNDNLALMFAPESDEVIRLEKESRSKLSDLIRPFDYDKLNNLYDLFFPQSEKSSEQRYFLERSRMSHTHVNNGNSTESFNKQTTLLEKRMDESIPWDQKCKSSKELFKIKRSVGTIFDGGERVIPTTSVSRPQLKSNPMEDRVMLNNSQGKKQEVEDHHRNVKFSKNKTSVPACNDSLNAKTLNVNFVCAICGKCVLNEKHDMKIVASESNHTPRNTTKKLYERISKACSWWYPKFTPPGYKWKPKSGKENVNPNLVEIVLFIVDSGCSKHMTGNLKLRINFVEKFLGTVKFGNDQIAPILGCGDLGNDLLTGSRGTDLYSITLQDTTSPNLICLMAKVTSSQAWLWHRHLSYLNFDTINLLSKNDIAITPSLKRRLKLLRMDLCGPMRVASINGKKYVLVIVDDYSRYTWTHFLRCKDETPEVLIDFLRLVQRGFHAQVRIVRTDKGTKFLNKTLHAYFASEGIPHQMSVARTPEQNGVVERRNRTLVEAARRMLSAAKVVSKSFAVTTADAPNQRQQQNTNPLNNQTTHDPTSRIRCRDVYVRTHRESTEPKNIKEAMADSTWIESMQEELHQFDRLDVPGPLEFAFGGFGFDLWAELILKLWNLDKLSFIVYLFFEKSCFLIRL